jgi:hypothetical protein
MKLEPNQSLTLEILAQTPWNETELDVLPGETYLFAAEGSWMDWGLKKTADGYANWYMNLYNRLKRVEEAKWFELIGSPDKINFYRIGSKSTTTFREAGTLCFFANDARCFYWNNSGKIFLKITRVS